MTLVRQLEKNAKELFGKTAIIYRGKKISYGELDNAVTRLSNAFLDMGLKKGDRVGLMLPRVPELVIGFLAIAKAHGIGMPINFELKAEDISSIISKVSPGFIVVHKTYLDIAKRSLSADSKTRLIVVDYISGSGSGNGSDFLSWDDLLEKSSAKNRGLDINDDDVFYLNYTSGSTGKPKGAITTHANIYWNTLASIDALGLTADDVHLCMFAPFAHPHEIFARPLYLGGTMVLVDRVSPKSIAEAISTCRVTCMMGLVPMYENLLEQQKLKSYDISSLRIPESGGMYTRDDLIERFRRKVGVPIIPVWGSTETTGIALAVRPGKKRPPGSVGKPCAHYEVKIVDGDGAEQPPGVIGEIAFKSPAIVKGYYGDIPTADSPFKNGLYYSNDLGRMDEEGNFYFVERKTGMMKVAGLKVYPLEIEQVLLNHPDIKEAVILAVKDKLRGEIPMAIVVALEGRELINKEIIRFCRECLPNYKIPRLLEIRDSLPKISSGKINKKVLQTEYA